MCNKNNTTTISPVYTGLIRKHYLNGGFREEWVRLVTTGARWRLEIDSDKDVDDPNIRWWPRHGGEIIVDEGSPREGYRLHKLNLSTVRLVTPAEFRKPFERKVTRCQNSGRLCYCRAETENNRAGPSRTRPRRVRYESSSCTRE